MDPLSITASVITVADAAHRIVKYILDVKNASSDLCNLMVSYFLEHSTLLLLKSCKVRRRCTAPEWTTDRKNRYLSRGVGYLD